MSHNMTVPSYGFKRAMPRNFKNAGSKAMGTTIDTPSKRESEPAFRSKVLPNPARNVGRGSFSGYKHSSMKMRSYERSEDMGKC